MSWRPSSTTRANVIAAGIAATGLLALGVAYYFTYEPAPAVSIQWRAGTSWERRAEIERRFLLLRAREQRERVVTYDLVDIRPANIKALVEQPEVENTGDLDLSTDAVPPDAPYGRGWMWIGTRLPILRNRGAVPGLVLLCGVVIAAALTKEARARRTRVLQFVTSMRGWGRGWSAVAEIGVATASALATVASQVSSGLHGGSRTSHVARLAAALLLATLGVTYYVTYERAPAVAIAWDRDLSPERYDGLARRFRLMRPRPKDEGPRPTIYDLQDIRTSNIEALLGQSEVDVTGNIDLQTKTIPADAPLGRGGMWIGTRLPILRIYGVVPAVVVMCLLVLASGPIRDSLHDLRMRVRTYALATDDLSAQWTLLWRKLLWRKPLWSSALAALIPAVIVLVLIMALFGAGPRQFLPVWSDEVVYWNEAAVFAEAGFRGGYIVIQEEPARAGFSRFGPHGPVFAAFHGSVAKAFGWRPYSAFLVNLAVVFLAAFAWVRATPAGRSPAALLVLATFWPLLLYLPTNMQEPTHFAIAFLVALAIDRHARGGRTTHVWTAILLIVAALIRPSWMLMVLPLAWRRARRRGAPAIAALLALTLGATAAAWSTFDVLAAPSPQNSRTLTRAWVESPGDALATFTQIASRNLRQYVARTEEPPQVVLRYFIAFFVAILALRCVVARPRSSTDGQALETAFLVIAPILVLVVLAGEVESWRDFRVLAPHVLVALLVLVANAQWERWLWAATLVLLPVYYDGFVAFHRVRFTTAPGDIAAIRDATSPTMPFVAGAPPWTNTVTVHSDLLQFPLLGLPRGIGVSYVFDWSNLATPVRSRYLLLRPSDEEQLSSKVRLTPIGSTPLGTLYRNDGPSP